RGARGHRRAGRAGPGPRRHPRRAPAQGAGGGRQGHRCRRREVRTARSRPAAAVRAAAAGRRRGRGRRAAVDQVEGLDGTPVTEAEVERAKTALLKGIERQLNDANQVGLTISNLVAAGDWRLYFLRRDRIEAVSAADVNRVAGAYLQASNRTAGVFHPT